MTDTLTFGSLFAGIGGFDRGLERAGMRCVWQVEIDDYCRRVLAKHWPDVERLEDVRECGAHNLEPVDLICAGFPCQPVSCAGKRQGDADDRWLWPEFHRVIRELKPRWVVGENVPGLLSANVGRLFGEILRDLAACGYAVEWDCIPASAVGAPHRRDRVWIVAHAKSAGRQTRGIDGMGTETSGSVYAPRSGDVADADCRGCLAEQSINGTGGSQMPSECLRSDVADANGKRRKDIGKRCAAIPIFRRLCQMPKVRGDSWWAVEPDVGRVAHGVLARVDRLRALGNAVVPQVAEWIGRRIVMVEAEMQRQ
jgi:DNA (cytosine-5)-methyltransferase 1